jgi:hypothetical protein
VLLAALTVRARVDPVLLARLEAVVLLARLEAVVLLARLEAVVDPLLAAVVLRLRVVVVLRGGGILPPS